MDLMFFFICKCLDWSSWYANLVGILQGLEIHWFY